MEIKQIIKNFWLLILGIPFGLYNFIYNNSVNSLISVILIVIFLIVIKFVKNYKYSRLIVGLFLALLAILEIVNIIQDGDLNVYRIIIIATYILLILIFFSKKTIDKIQEIRGNSTVQNILFCLVSSYICYMVVMRGPTDFLENLIVIVSGVFALITAWFLFYDLNKN